MTKEEYKTARRKIGFIEEVAVLLGIDPAVLTSRESGEIQLTSEHVLAMRWLLASAELQDIREESCRHDTRSDSLPGVMPLTAATLAAEVILSGGLPLGPIAEALRSGKAYADPDDVQLVAKALMHPESIDEYRPDVEYFIGIMEKGGDQYSLQILQRGEGQSPGVQSLMEQLMNSQ